ncbi:hypothetical protein CANCADRAFT_2760 [Tortispora caseinolytica NRRL Y-17796]|uniref:R3H-associated N-terminal domain-containing protein n=1 Tax=Tortispora caseinolytica NRRL Y-17796 TaxID=767744 RepID=A0A1E4TGZ9_9ASCO|nr:hypothetical protein CANCADRAFT_2760 [Tortispora caseinolytica NRRL Y-17796]
MYLLRADEEIDLGAGGGSDSAAQRQIVGTEPLVVEGAVEIAGSPFLAGSLNLIRPELIRTAHGTAARSSSREIFNVRMSRGYERRRARHRELQDFCASLAHVEEDRTLDELRVDYSPLVPVKEEELEERYASITTEEKPLQRGIISHQFAAQLKHRRVNPYLLRTIETEIREALFCNTDSDIQNCTVSSDNICLIDIPGDEPEFCSHGRWIAHQLALYYGVRSHTVKLDSMTQVYIDLSSESLSEMLSFPPIASLTS